MPSKTEVAGFIQSTFRSVWALELLCLLPDVDETNKTFYADVWQPQEIQHGLILDRLQQDLGRPPAEPHLEVSFKIKILGALAWVLFFKS